MKTLTLIFAALATATSATAQDERQANLAQRVDALFEQFDRTDSPGCAVGVIEDGDYIFERGYGMANLEHGVPIDSRTVFRIGSVSKQFTAAAIALLVQRGAIDLDAGIHTYLPDLPDYGRPVTVRQMVHHVSGMGDYEGFEVRPGEPFRFGDEDYWTTEQFYAEVTKKPLAHGPEAGWQYSNIAYFLLAQMIERVSGQKLRDFAEEAMFAPLEMNQTQFYDDVRRVLPGRAQGYAPLRSGSYRIFMTNLDWVGDGGVHTSLADFLTWDRALSEGQLPGGAALSEMLHTPAPETVGKVDAPGTPGSGYAFGMTVSVLNGRDLVWHGGSWVGFRAGYARFPEEGVSAVLMCNRADAFNGNRIMKFFTAVAEWLDAK